MKSLAPFVAAIPMLAAAAGAQVVPGVFGHTVTGRNGTAGEFCWSFDCTPRPLAIVGGETLTLRVNAPYQAIFAVGASFGATRCAPVPGLRNMLVLDPTIVILGAGAVTGTSPILACWGGYEQLALVLPPGLPTGLTLATQAVAEVPDPFAGTQFSFSVATLLTVQ